MHLRVSSVLLFLFWIVVAAPAQKTIHVPADQPTIQAGIDAASNGDTVLVSPGTYAESVDFQGKAITVTSSDGPSVTIIDGQNFGKAAVLFTHGEPRTAVLNGFTIRNGSANRTQDLGGSDGGIYLSTSAPTISNNVLSQNHCYGIQSNRSSPVIQGNTINTTLDAGGNCGFAAGAAIWLSGSQGYYNGGGSPSGLPAVVLANTLENNTQSGREDAGSNGGAGIAIWGADALIENNIIRNNATLGIAAVYSINSARVSLTGNLIYGNSASGGTAGVMLELSGQNRGPFDSIIANNTIYGNTIPNPNYLPGPFASDLELAGTLSQNLLVNNLVQGTMATLPALSCRSISNTLTPTPLVLDHNDVFNRNGPAYDSACVDPASYGNISADPLFVNPTSGDFHLRPGSPALDSGNTSAVLLLPVDLANAPRVQDATGLGYPVIDRGALEATGLQQIIPTTVYLTPSTYFVPNVLGPPPGPFTLTANLLAGATPPSGPVTFYEDLQPIATVDSNPWGTAVLQPLISPGLHAFTASYPGVSPFAPAVSVKFYVLFPKSTPSLTLASSPNPSVVGQAVTFTAQASYQDGAPPSTLSLTDSSTNTVLASLPLDASGHASFTTSSLTPGSHIIVAALAETATDFAASAAVTQVVVSAPATTLQLTSSSNPSAAGQPVTFFAHVASPSAVPSGTLIFSDGTTTLATVPLDGNANATLTTASLSVQFPAPHIIRATYQPTGNFAPGSGSLSQLVVDSLTAVRTTTTLTANPNPATEGQVVTLTVNLQAAYPQVPAGSVQFYDGGSLLGIGTLSSAGQATLTTTSLSPGAHDLSATFAPVGIFLGSTSALVSQTILVPSFTVTLTPSAIQLSQGQVGRTTLQLHSTGGFTGTLQISTGALPPSLTASFVPNTAALHAGTDATIVLNLATAVDGGPITSASRRSLPGSGSTPWLAFLSLPLFLLRGRKRARSRLLSILLAFLALQSFTGCTDVRIPFRRVDPGTYTLPITATDGAGHQQTADLTLTITPG